MLFILISFWDRDFPFDVPSKQCKVSSHAYSLALRFFLPFFNTPSHMLHDPQYPSKYSDHIYLLVNHDFQDETRKMPFPILTHYRKTSQVTPFSCMS